MVQLAKKELAYAQVAQRRYEAGPEPEVQAAAEVEYGIALREIGHSWEDTHALAMAAEAFMNFSPWDYQHVSSIHWGAQATICLLISLQCSPAYHNLLAGAQGGPQSCLTHASGHAYSIH